MRDGITLPLTDYGAPVSEISEPVDSPPIEMSPGAADALRARGGNLYIWADKAGLLRARVTPPPESITFDTVVLEGCSIHIEQGIAPISSDWFWEITWHRFLWPRFAATTRYRRGTVDSIVSGIDLPWP